MEAGILIILVEPQVEGAGQGEQAGGLPDSAAGHVAICERRAAGTAELPATMPPPEPPCHLQPQPLPPRLHALLIAHFGSPPWVQPDAAHSGTT